MPPSRWAFLASRRGRLVLAPMRYRSRTKGGDSHGGDTTTRFASFLGGRGAIHG